MKKETKRKELFKAKIINKCMTESALMNFQTIEEWLRVQLQDARERIKELKRQLREEY